MFFFLGFDCIFYPMYIFLINLVVILLINLVIFCMNSFIIPCIPFAKLLIYLSMMIQNLFIHLWRFGIAISRNKINIVLPIFLLLMHFYEWAYFMRFYMHETAIFTAFDVKFKHTFVGGGTST